MVCMTGVVILIVAHISVIMNIRDFSVPVVGQLPQLERRLHALTEQAELTELHAAVRTGSQSEKVAMFALPSEMDMTRFIATFEVISDVFKRDGVLASMDEIEVSEPEQEDDATVRTVTTELVLRDDGLKNLLLLIQISGLLTVGDLLTEEESTLLVDRIEQENPSGIVALEQFLSADLLQYAKNPKTYEEQLKRSFTSTVLLNALENVLRTSLLYDVKHLLRSEVGEILDGYKLWPMQSMAVREIALEPGTEPNWFTVNLTLDVFSAEK